MSRRLLAAAAPLVLALALAGCGGGEDSPETGPASSPSSPTTSETPTETPTQAPAGTTIELTRESDVFDPNGARVEAQAGEPIVLVITADEPGELHVHSTPEQEVDYEAGTSTHELTIDTPGVVEVESHEPHGIVLQLEVR